MFAFRTASIVLVGLLALAASESRADAEIRCELVKVDCTNHPNHKCCGGGLKQDQIQGKSQKHGKKHKRHKSQRSAQ